MGSEGAVIGGEEGTQGAYNQLSGFLSGIFPVAVQYHAVVMDNPQDATHVEEAQMQYYEVQMAVDFEEFVPTLICDAVYDWVESIPHQNISYKPGHITNSSCMVQRAPVCMSLVSWRRVYMP